MNCKCFWNNFSQFFPDPYFTAIRHYRIILVSRNNNAIPLKTETLLDPLWLRLHSREIWISIHCIIQDRCFRRKFAFNSTFHKLLIPKLLWQFHWWMTDIFTHHVIENSIFWNTCKYTKFRSLSNLPQSGKDKVS